MNRMKIWLILTPISIVVLGAVSWFLLAWGECRKPDVYNADYGKPLVLGSQIVTNRFNEYGINVVDGEGSFSTKDSSDQRMPSAIAFIDENFVYWSNADRKLVLLGKNGETRFISGQQIPTSQDVIELVPVRSGLLINTNKYVLDARGLKDYSRSSAYRVDLVSGDIKQIENVISARGDSTSDIIAVITQNGDFQLINNTGESTLIPNMHVDPSNWYAWDFDPSHHLIAFYLYDKKHWDALNIFNTTGDLIKKIKISRVWDIVFQPSRNEIWVATEPGGWKIDTQDIAIYDLMGTYRGIRYRTIGLELHRPFLPVEDWMKEIIASHNDNNNQK